MSSHREKEKPLKAGYPPNYPPEWKLKLVIKKLLESINAPKGKKPGRLKRTKYAERDNYQDGHVVAAIEDLVLEQSSFQATSLCWRALSNQVAALAYVPHRKRVLTWKFGAMSLFYEAEDIDILRSFARVMIDRVGDCTAPSIIMDLATILLSSGNIDHTSQLLEDRANSISKYASLDIRASANLYKAVAKYVELMKAKHQEAGTQGLLGNQGAQEVLNSRVETKANKVVEITKTILSLGHSGNFDAIISVTVEILTCYDRLEEAEELLLDYMNINPSQPGPFILLHKFYTKHYSEKDPRAIMNLRELLQVTSCDEHLIDLCDMLDKDDVAGKLYILFNLADHQQWRDSEEVWGKLAKILIIELPIYEDAKKLDQIANELRERMSWWDSYHFTAPFAPNEKEILPRLAIYKILVATVIYGSDHDFVRPFSDNSRKPPVSCDGMNVSQGMVVRGKLLIDDSPARSLKSSGSRPCSQRLDDFPNGLGDYLSDCVSSDSEDEALAHNESSDSSQFDVTSMLDENGQSAHCVCDDWSHDSGDENLVSEPCEDDPDGERVYQSQATICGSQQLSRLKSVSSQHKPAEERTLRSHSKLSTPVKEKSSRSQMFDDSSVDQPNSPEPVRSGSSKQSSMVDPNSFISEHGQLVATQGKLSSTLDILKLRRKLEPAYELALQQSQPPRRQSSDRDLNSSAESGLEMAATSRLRSSPASSASSGAGEESGGQSCNQLFEPSQCGKSGSPMKSFESSTQGEERADYIRFRGNVEFTSTQRDNRPALGDVSDLESKFGQDDAELLQETQLSSSEASCGSIIMASAAAGSRTQPDLNASENVAAARSPATTDDSSRSVEAVVGVAPFATKFYSIFSKKICGRRQGENGDNARLDGGNVPLQVSDCRFGQRGTTSKDGAIATSQNVGSNEASGSTSRKTRGHEHRRKGENCETSFGSVQRDNKRLQQPSIDEDGTCRINGNACDAIDSVQTIPGLNSKTLHSKKNAKDAGVEQIGSVKTGLIETSQKKSKKYRMVSQVIDKDAEHRECGDDEEEMTEKSQNVHDIRPESEPIDQEKCQSPMVKVGKKKQVKGDRHRSTNKENRIEKLDSDLVSGEIEADKSEQVEVGSDWCEARKSKKRKSTHKEALQLSVCDELDSCDPPIDLVEEQMEEKRKKKKLKRVTGEIEAEKQEEVGLDLLETSMKKSKKKSRKSKDNDALQLSVCSSELKESTKESKKKKNSKKGDSPVCQGSAALHKDSTSQSNLQTEFETAQKFKTKTRSPKDVLNVPGNMFCSIEVISAESCLPTKKRKHKHLSGKGESDRTVGLSGGDGAIEISKNKKVSTVMKGEGDTSERFLSTKCLNLDKMKMTVVNPDGPASPPTNGFDITKNKAKKLRKSTHGNQSLPAEIVTTVVSGSRAKRKEKVAIPDCLVDSLALNSPTKTSNIPEKKSKKLRKPKVDHQLPPAENVITGSQGKKSQLLFSHKSSSSKDGMTTPVKFDRLISLDLNETCNRNGVSSESIKSNSKRRKKESSEIKGDACSGVSSGFKENLTKATKERSKSKTKDKSAKEGNCAKLVSESIEANSDTSKSENLMADALPKKKKKSQKSDKKRLLEKGAKKKKKHKDPKSKTGKGQKKTKKAKSKEKKSKHKTALKTN